MPRQHQAARLFLVKMWVEEEGAGAVRWQGSVRQVVSGEARFFDDWPGLVSILGALLPATGQGEPEAAGEAGAARRGGAGPADEVG